jgi:hypothetical protein
MTRPRVIFDSAEPVVVREYANESLAALDEAVLAAADIPAMLLQARYSELQPQRVRLAVRRRDLAAALELLDPSGSEREAAT